MPTASDRSRLISIVQSRQNARVRELRAAFSRSPQDESDIVGIEGEHLLAEALRSGLRVRTVFVRAEADRRDASLRMLARLELPAAVPIVSLNPALFASAVDTDSPQGVAALVERPRFSLAEALAESQAGWPPLVLVAAALQDPGNFGTLVRSAEAFGATGVIALPGTVDAWNAKALRASAGSAFRVPVVAARTSAVLAAFKERGIPAVAAVPATRPGEPGGTQDAIPCTDFDWRKPAAILIGNEGAGLSQDLLERADKRVTIPMPGPVESLNAAVAGSVLLYEAARQRENPRR